MFIYFFTFIHHLNYPSWEQVRFGHHFTIQALFNVKISGESVVALSKYY